MSQDEKNGCDSDTLTRKPRTQEAVALDAIKGPAKQYFRCLENFKALSLVSRKAKKGFVGQAWKESLVAREAHERAKAAEREMNSWLRKMVKAAWRAIYPLPLIDSVFGPDDESEEQEQARLERNYDAMVAAEKINDEAVKKGERPDWKTDYPG